MVWVPLPTTVLISEHAAAQCNHATLCLKAVWAAPFHLGSDASIAVLKLNNPEVSRQFQLDGSGVCVSKTATILWSAGEVTICGHQGFMLCCLTLACFFVDHDGTKQLGLGKVRHLNAANKHLSWGTGKNSEGTASGLLGTLTKSLPPKTATRTLLLLFATQAETMCETQKGIISLSMPGKDDRKTETKIVQSAAETIHRSNTEEGDSSFFIPWRKHLLETEEPENLTQKSSPPEEKLSLKSPTPPEKQEGQSVNENMPVTEENRPTCFANAREAAEDTSVLVGEGKRTVEHTDHNVEVMMESFGILKECCDKMCMSMSNLQGVLEMLITVLKE